MGKKSEKERKEREREKRRNLEIFWESMDEHRQTEHCFGLLG